MEKQVSITPETVLYLVAGTGHTQIVGIPDAFADKSEADAQAIKSRADSELTDKGLASMDMEGNVKIDEGLISMICDAADSRKILAFSIRNGKAFTKDAVFYTENEAGGVLMTRSSEQDYYYTEPCTFTRTVTDDAIKQILEFIGLPENKDNSIKQTVVESKVLISVTEDKLKEAGVDPESAEFIASAYNGDVNTITAITQINGSIQDAGAWMYGEKGIMSIEVSYEDNKELVKMTPEDPATVKDILKNRILSIYSDEA